MQRNTVSIDRQVRNAVYYLSVDVGTTGGKVLLFSEDMELHQIFRRDYPTYRSDSGDQAEHDPEDWWKMCRAGIREVLAAERIGGESVAGIGLSCMTPIVLPVDRTGKALTRAWLWYDRRGASMLPEIHAAFQPGELQELCGSECKEISFLPKLLYLRKTQPEIYREADAFVQANGYLIRRLTGQRCLDTSHGELLHLVEAKSGQYSDRVFSALGLERAKFPDLIGSDRIAGRITPEAAKETGLATGTPVVSGGHDSALSAYAFGMDREGKACLDIGSAANLVMASGSTVACPAADAYRYPEKGKWLFQIYSATIGTSLRWFAQTFCQEELRVAKESGRSVYDILCEEAKQAPAGADGLLFYPCLQGAQQCSRLSGSFRGIRLPQGKECFIRALLEGCAMSVRYNKEQMEQASGIRISELTACGGGSKNDDWLQIFADIMGLPIRTYEITEAAATGAAMLAYAAVTGKNPLRNRRSERTIRPTESGMNHYETVYRRFKDGFEQQIREPEAD
jgi:xylulokinase